MSIARAQLDSALARSRHDDGVVAPGEIFPSSEIGSLADLLLDDEPSRRGGIICPCCRGCTPRVVRVRPGGAKRWLAVCAICAGRMLAGHPQTIVGGRVRPRLKRAG
ncbi:MAG: hypothetical protein D6692_01455 [Planctomycetota bacterium]|nr:MAG: hypothetical protein D6692_01455 [Planctomycetota bacterium]